MGPLMSQQPGTLCCKGTKLYNTYNITVPLVSVTIITSAVVPYALLFMRKCVNDSLGVRTNRVASCGQCVLWLSIGQCMSEVVHGGFDNIQFSLHSLQQHSLPTYSKLMLSLCMPHAIPHSVLPETKCV